MAAKKTLGLAAALEAHATPKTLGVIDTALRDLPPEDSALLSSVLADRRYTGAQIAKALTAIGFPIGSSSVVAYRRNRRP